MSVIVLHHKLCFSFCCWCNLHSMVLPSCRFPQAQPPQGGGGGGASGGGPSLDDDGDDDLYGS